MISDWHVSRAGETFGPFDWEQLVAMVREGRVMPDDLVYRSDDPRWVRAADVPGLFGVTPPQSVTPPPQPGPQQQPTSPRRSRTPLLIGLGLAAVVAIGGCIGAFLLFGDGGGGSDDALTYTPPAESAVVETEEWGAVPASQVCVTLLEGESRRAAEKVAERLGGQITGEIGFIDLYVIDTGDTTEEELRQALELAQSAEGVEFAFPNQVTYLDVTFTGVMCTPMDDHAYAEGRGRPHEMIGHERAMAIMRAAGLDLSPVRVGITDDGLCDTGELDGKTTWVTSEADDKLAAPLIKGGVPDPNGSHGTAVANIIGANPDDGGMVGIAAPALGDKLTVEMKNVFGPKYGKYSRVATESVDPNDPTQVAYSNGTFAVGNLVALKGLVDSGAKVINCSWGNSNAHPYTAAAYKKFFEKMAADHPDVLFVCSAGNNGSALDGTKRYPSGLALSNMITVGNLDNDGSRWNSSNMNSANFEVTLAAPGHRIVSGVTADGTISNEYGGTSFATPQVTSAAALLLSINPDLKAADIKRILSETARPGVEVPELEQSILIPQEVGGRILAIDEAVLKVVNEMRVKKGLAVLTEEDISGSSAIELIAESGEDGVWSVRATLPKVAEGGSDVELSYQGEGAIGGLTRQNLSGPGTVEWTAQLLDDDMTIHVKRHDSGACWRVTIQSFAGTYSGYFIDPLRGPSGSADIQVPITMTVGADNSVSGSFDYSGNPGISGVTNWSESGTFTGTVAEDGTVTASGTARSSVTFSGSGETVGDSGDFSVKGSIAGGTFSGSMSAINGTVEVVLQRE